MGIVIMGGGLLCVNRYKADGLILHHIICKGRIAVRTGASFLDLFPFFSRPAPQLRSHHQIYPASSKTKGTYYDCERNCNMSVNPELDSRIAKYAQYILLFFVSGY